MIQAAARGSQKKKMDFWVLSVVNGSCLGWELGINPVAWI